MALPMIEKPVDLDRALEAALEEEIREFTRRDEASLRRATETDSELVTDNLGTLFQRMAGTSVQEIDRLIAELQTLRSQLQDQGARVQRKLAGYAHLSQSAIESTKIIAESLVEWKKVGDCRSHTAPHRWLESRHLG
jgi:signal transduction histidine kinase